MTRVLALTALDVEAARLARYLRLRRVPGHAWGHYRRGPIEVVAIGLGGLRLEERAGRCPRPTLVVSAGTCVALDPALAPGDLVVPEVVIAPGVDIPVEVVAQIPPTIQPTPTPPPVFDPYENTSFLANYLASNISPSGQPMFCDLQILDSIDNALYVQIFAWVYCRIFAVVDEQLVPGMVISAPYSIDVFWSPDAPGWQVSGFGMADPRYGLSPGAQQLLLEAPYDEVAGEQRLLQQARQALLGE